MIDYTPTIQNVQGQIPFSQTYTVVIEAPVNLDPAFPSLVSFPASAFVVTNKPAGVSDATAISYVTFSPTTLTFTTPGRSAAEKLLGVPPAPAQLRQVDVTFTAAPGIVPGDYGYQWKAVGWQVLSGLTNTGSSINATVTAIGAPQPPVVAISSPLNGSTYTTSTFPYTIPFAFTANDIGTVPSNIVSVDVLLDGTSITPSLAISGLGTLSVTGSGTLTITTPGVHTISVGATNGATPGTTTVIHTFTVSQTGVPPTVVINTPPLGASYGYPVGGPLPVIPFLFTGTSTSGNIIGLTAKLNGSPIAFSTSGVGTAAVATGSVANLSPLGVVPGLNTLVVTATNGFGTSTEFTRTFNVGTPPVVTIGTAPPNGQIIGYAAGGTRPTIPFAFTGTSAFGNVTGLTVTITNSAGTNPIPLSAFNVSPALGTFGTITATALGGGLPASLTQDGVNTVTVTATNAFGTSTSVSTSFDLGQRPVATITVPAAGSTYSYVAGGTRPVIPFTFQGTSLLGNITGLSATLNGTTAISFTPSPALGTALVVTGNTTGLGPTLTQDGVNTLTVTATNKYGTSAAATQAFTINVLTQQLISGKVFLDVNFNGVLNAPGEPGLGGITVTIKTPGGAVVAQTTTTSTGDYTFSLMPGSYVAVVSGIPGLSPTTLNEHPFIVPLSGGQLPNTGFGLNFAAIRGLNGAGFSHGYWKNNISKANDGKTNGTQETKANLIAWTNTISTLMLSPFAGLTMTSAETILSSKDQLALQLLASEYNLVSGRLINNSVPLTSAFIYWGEYVMANPSLYSSSYRNFVKDWMDAFNNSHGGKVLGPLP